MESYKSLKAMKKFITSTDQDSLTEVIGAKLIQLRQEQLELKKTDSTLSADKKEISTTWSRKDARLPELHKIFENKVNSHLDYQSKIKKIFWSANDWWMN